MATAKRGIKVTAETRPEFLLGRNTNILSVGSKNEKVLNGGTREVTEPSERGNCLVNAAPCWGAAGQMIHGHCSEA